MFIDCPLRLYSDHPCCVSENGYFYIVNRLNKLIKVNSFQVAPAELEALLLQQPHISDVEVMGITWSSSVTVLGVDDERSGEFSPAFVVRSSDELSEQQVGILLRDK